MIETRLIASVLMSNKKKPSLVDWVIAAALAIPSFFLLVWWIALPKTETKSDCYQQVADEIKTQKLQRGESTIKNQEEIEAIASEIKLKCR